MTAPRALATPGLSPARNLYVVSIGHGGRRVVFSRRAAARFLAWGAPLSQEREAELYWRDLYCNAKLVEYDQDLADIGQRNAEATKDVEGNQVQLALDQTFSAILNKKRANSDEQFKARVEARLAETGVVENTIEIWYSHTFREYLTRA